MKKTILLLLLSTACITQLKAQTDTATTNFVTKATIGGIQEVVDGKLAGQKASSADVKAYGNRMVTDHTKANEELTNIVTAKQIQVPAPAKSAVPDIMLTKADGKDFDKMYVHMMVPDHRKTVALFQNYATNGKDPELKAFAQKTLPILQDHLATITAIEKKMAAGQ